MPLPGLQDGGLVGVACRMQPDQQTVLGRRVVIGGDVGPVIVLVGGERFRDQPRGQLLGLAFRRRLFRRGRRRDE